MYREMSLFDLNNPSEYESNLLMKWCVYETLNTHLLSEYITVHMVAIILVLKRPISSYSHIGDHWLGIVCSILLISYKMLVSLSIIYTLKLQQTTHFHRNEVYSVLNPLLRWLFCNGVHNPSYEIILSNPQNIGSNSFNNLLTLGSRPPRHFRYLKRDL